MATERVSATERIVMDHVILVGKPTVRGTRISVELVLRHLAGTLDIDDLFEAYPSLTREDMRSCLEYALSLVEKEQRPIVEQNLKRAAKHRG